MGDHWNGDGSGERMGGYEKTHEDVRGRASDEDEFDDYTEDQDEEDIDEDEEEGRV